MLSNGLIKTYDAAGAVVQARAGGARAGGGFWG